MRGHCYSTGLNAYMIMLYFCACVCMLTSSPSSLPRNPSHNGRPSASDICGEFCKSERILLSWKKEDIVSPSAQVLGGPLSEGEELYKDLQSIKQSKNNTYYY